MAAPPEAGTRTAGARERLRLGPEQLVRHLDPASLPFRTTAELEPCEGIFGQPRALAALEFGLHNSGRGYNLFVTGQPGSGRTGAVLERLRAIAGGLPAPPDWVHVYDFEHPDEPKAIGLPPGDGRRLQEGIDGFLVETRRRIAAAFEGEALEEQRRRVAAPVLETRARLMEGLTLFGREREFAIQEAPNGFVAIPLLHGHPMSPEEAEKLAPERRELMQRRGQEVEAKVVETIRLLRQADRELGEAMAKLNRDTCLAAVEPLLHELREQFGHSAGVLAHLDAIAADLPNHVGDFAGKPAPESGGTPLEEQLQGDHLDRYRINLLVDTDGHSGAPVVQEPNPTYQNLLGRIEYRGIFGMLMTDFRQVKAGALHRANGGFLVLEAKEVLSNPFAWETLKRALRSGELRIENLGDRFSALPTGTLRPAPVPFSAKVILVGSPLLHQLLHSLDEEFGELFKVKVDFSPDMPWTDEHVLGYARLLARRAAEDGLRPFDAGAVARVVEEASREQEHRERLNARLREVLDLASEASYWAGEAGRETVTAGDVERALRERDHRSDLVEERLDAMLAEGSLVVATEGSKVGQVNALSVLDLGDFAFARPTRVTATVALGRGGVESIEREIELSGRIHSKGVLTLGSYLSAAFAQERPLPVHATLSFEQSYDEVEGDSAASAELYALLSALSGVPLDQGVAVTGSVDQHGVVQAVGAVARKIEGFYRVCRARGLNGAQGVIVPAANLPHLMVGAEVEAAVREGSFHVWAVRAVDEGIELLTGRPAAEVRSEAARRVSEFGERLKASGPQPNGSQATHR